MRGAENVGARSNREVVGGGDFRGDDEIGDAEVGAGGGVVFDDIIKHAFDAGNWDGEADTVSA